MISGYMLYGLALLVILASIAAIDIRSRRIPDPLTLLLSLVGLTLRIATEGRFPLESLIAGIVAAGLLWTLAVIFRHLRGAVGLGLGDIKMTGAAAIWVSPWNLPLLLVIACCTALLYAAAAALAGRAPGKLTRIPFGPFIGVGLLITWGLEIFEVPTLVPSDV